MTYVCSKSEPMVQSSASVRFGKSQRSIQCYFSYNFSVIVKLYSFDFLAIVLVSTFFIIIIVN